MDNVGLVTAFRLIARFSGVAMLLGLLVSLPWLPITSTTASAVSGSPMVRPDAGAGMPIFELRKPSTKFTVHLVGSDNELAAMQARFPDVMTDLVFIVQPGEEDGFIRWRMDVDRVRDNVRLPPLLLVDHRCPAGPEPALCSPLSVN